VFHDDVWPHPSGLAAALTTLHFDNDDESDRNGEILDADIEFNGQNFAISDDGISTRTGCLADLRNTLTHEVGHLLGLDHTCLDAIPGPDEPIPLDHRGEPALLCSATSPPEVTEATMYNFQDCGETKKATLEQDDIDAICAMYPLSRDPGKVERASLTNKAGCCAVAPGTRDSKAGGASLWSLGLLMLGVIGLRRRRRR